MKKLLIGIIFLASTSAFATTYDCTISQEDLGSNFSEDLSFVLDTNNDGTASLSVLDDPVSDDCEVQGNAVACEDDESMIYLLEITEPDTILLSVGGYLSRAQATCK